MTLFLAVNALIWLPYGLWCLVRPDTLMAVAGVSATTPTAVAELRAMYGGLQAAIGAVAMTALLKPAHRSTIVMVLGTLTAGLGTARLVAALTGSGFSSYTVGGLVFELGATVWAASLLKR